MGLQEERLLDETTPGTELRMEAPGVWVLRGVLHMAQQGVGPCFVLWAHVAPAVVSPPAWPRPCTQELDRRGTWG